MVLEMKTNKMVLNLNIYGHLIGILYHFDVQTWAKSLCRELFGTGDVWRPIT